MPTQVVFTSMDWAITRYQIGFIPNSDWAMKMNLRFNLITLQYYHLRSLMQPAESVQSVLQEQGIVYGMLNKSTTVYKPSKRIPYKQANGFPVEEDPNNEGRIVFP